MLFPPLLVPPSEGRLDTLYCTFVAVAGACARAAPQQTAIRIVTRIWLVLLFVSCVFIFLSFVDFFMRTFWGLAVVHTKSPFARSVQATSLFIHGSINESSGEISGSSENPE